MSTAGEVLAGELGRVAEAPAAQATVDSPEWFANLVQQHLRRVYSVLYRMVGNFADAQDLAQDVFLKAFLHRGQLREPERALSWLMRIASNTAIDFQRARPDRFRSEPWSEELSPGSIEPTAEQRLLEGEREQRLHRAMRLLSPKERAAIVLRDLEGLEGAEVARALGCSPITVRAHIANARIKLRRILGKV